MTETRVPRVRRMYALDGRFPANTGHTARRTERRLRVVKSRSRRAGSAIRGSILIHSSSACLIVPVAYSADYTLPGAPGIPQRRRRP